MKWYTLKDAPKIIKVKGHRKEEKTLSRIEIHNCTKIILWLFIITYLPTQ